MTKKYLVAIIAGILFCNHLICTLLYNAPVNPLTGSYERYVANYIEPFFTQKWLLFAPEPATSELKLWYRVKYKNAWNGWLDPMEPVLRKHQHNRFTYDAKLLYVYGNIPRDLSVKYDALERQFACNDTNDIVCQQTRNDSLVISPEFKLAKEYVKRDIANSMPVNSNIDSLQIMIIHIYPKQYSERLSKKPFGFANPVEFIPVSFNDAN